MRSIKKKSTILVTQPSYLHSIVRSFAQVTAVIFTESDREATWDGKAAKDGSLMPRSRPTRLPRRQGLSPEARSPGQLLGSPLPSQVLK
jgi:hypothetical protein